MATQKKRDEQLRKEYIAKLAKFFQAEGEEVLVTNSNELALPVLDSERNERFVQVVVKVPQGTREGEAYDGYAEAEDYALRLRLKAEAKAEAEKKKAKKIARDTKMRAEKAKARKAQTEQLKKKEEEGV